MNKKYKKIFQTSDILALILGGAPTDEYDFLAETVYEKGEGIKNVDEMREIIRGAIKEGFGEEIKINEEKLRKISEELTSETLAETECMTREEYQKYTDIQGPEEARKLTKVIKRIFFVLFLGMIVGQIFPFYVNNETALTYTTIYILFYGYFIYKCWEIVKKTKKVTRAEIFFSFFFAPISWIWFYRDLLEPLEVISGQREIPNIIRLNKELTDEQRKNIRRNTWRTIGTITGVSCVIFGAIIAIAFLVEGS